MIIIRQYTVKKDDNGILHIKGNNNVGCSMCGGKMLTKDTRKRIYIAEDGSKDTIYIRRLRCALCKKIHTELPVFLLPEKRYGAAMVLSQFFDKDSADSNICQAENSTIYRWQKEMSIRILIWYMFFTESVKTLIHYQSPWNCYTFLVQFISLFNQKMEDVMQTVGENIYSFEEVLYYFDKDIFFLY